MAGQTRSTGMLPASDNLLAQLVRHAGIPLVLSEPTGRWLAASEEMLDLCGLAPGSWEGQAPDLIRTAASPRGAAVIEALTTAASDAPSPTNPPQSVHVDLPVPWSTFTAVSVRQIAISSPSGTVSLLLGMAVPVASMHETSESGRRADQLIHDLASSPHVVAGDVEAALPAIAGTAAEITGVDRVGIWLMVGDEEDVLACRALWERGSGVRLDPGPSPSGPYRAYRYYDILRAERVLAVHDVYSDPRVSEFADNYYPERGVLSTLDAPIMVRGDLAGVICLESTTPPPRHWTSEDENAAISLAEIVSHLLEAVGRGRFESALSRSEREKALILDGVEDAVILLDEDMRVVWANKSATSALRAGGKPAGTHWTELWRDTVLTVEEESAIAAIARGDTSPAVLRYPDGCIRRTRLHTLSDPGGGPDGRVVFAHDISDIRYSEDLSEASREIVEAGLSVSRMDDLYAAIHRVIGKLVAADNFYIAIYDPKADMIHFPYYIDRFDTKFDSRKPGRGMTEMVLRNAKPIFATMEDQTAFISRGEMELYGELSRWWLGVPLVVEGRVFGVMCVQSYSDNPPLDERQRDALLYLSGTAALVIERRRFEEALSESESRYRNLIERADDGVILARDGKAVFGNPALLRMLRLTPEEFEGHQFTEFLAPGEREKVLDRHQRRLRGEDVPRIYETAVIDRQERVIPVELQTSVVIENGQPATLSIVRDISERKRIEEERKLLERQIQQSQKLESLGILAGGIAHDFNNLLMGILGNAGLALMELPPESPVRRTLERLETAAIRAAELTNQLLAYSGRGKFVVEPVNLNILIEEMVNLLQAAVPKNVVLRLDLAQGINLIEGDATQLRQVIMNLIINAAEAIGDRSGAITVATGMTLVDRSYLAGTYMDEDMPEGTYVFIEVSDTGCGMDEKTKARIFDPFFTTKFTGRGLGLAAVLGIVRGHMGTLKVYSEPGKGSTFKVLFPGLEEAKKSSESSPAAGGEAQPTGCILVVDDEETVRTVVKIALEKSGFRTSVACDGREALEIFRRNDGAFDLVLLDMTMPHMNGEETFREFRRIKPDVKVILSSGYNEMDAVNRFSGKGLAGFIQKPYRTVDLVAKVRRVVAGERRDPGAPEDGPAGRPGVEGA